MDVESVASELYSLPRDEFTAARNAAAKQAREQGHRELAERIGALRRPSTAAWLVNQVVREHPDEVRALVELGDGLRAALRRSQGDQLRQLSGQRHELVQALLQQAQALARAAGHPAGDAVIRELTNTFTAAANSSTAAWAVLGGQLTTALDPADAATEVFAGAGAAHQPDPDSGARQDHGKPPRDLERARRAASDAATHLDETQRALTDADQAVQDAGAARRALRARLEAAERTEHEARRRAQSARRDVETADRAAREARRRVHDLEHRSARSR